MNVCFHSCLLQLPNAKITASFERSCKIFNLKGITAGKRRLCIIAVLIFSEILRGYKVREDQETAMPDLSCGKSDQVKISGFKPQKKPPVIGN